MNFLLLIAIISLVLSGMSTMLFVQNCLIYRAPRSAKPQAAEASRVAVLIPARDEETSIEACVQGALSSETVSLEVIVLDDGSTDRTAEIVRSIAAQDDRVRVEAAPPLPAGWCGKQHACFELSKLATSDWLVFIDADVRLSRDAVVRAVEFAIESDAPLVSGFPREVTVTWLEKLLIPLIHFVLLGFLPIARMRTSTSPAYGAGCGQFFVARRDIYQRVGGHSAIRASLHDGVKLPRAFRAAGFKTDLFDATELASCRMYRTAPEIWGGLMKNATEGMASAAAIVPWTIVLGAGQILPFALLVVASLNRSIQHRTMTIALCALSVLMSYAVRAIAVVRFRQSLFGAIAHPLGVGVLLMIQWVAFSRKLLGGKSEWKGRAYSN